jgi:GntR family transcriptional regulator
LVRYLELANLIRAEFGSGHWRDGQALPTETDLCTIHGVSRTTVRAALDVLETEGLIRRQQGSGTFFRDGGIRKDLGSLVDFNTEAAAAGRAPSTTVLDLVRRPATLQECALFGTGLAGGEVVELRRLRRLDDTPAVFQTSFLSAGTIGEVSARELENASLYRFLADRRAIVVADIEETLEPHAVDEEHARTLAIAPGTAVFRSKRIARDVGGRVIEISDNLIRGDIYRFTVRRSGAGRLE